MLQHKLDEVWLLPPLLEWREEGSELGEGRRQHLAQWASTTQQLHSLNLLLAP